MCYDEIKGVNEMKRYTSKTTKWFAILTLIGVIFFVVGILFVIVDIHNIGLQIGVTMLGSLMGILFAVCFFADRSRALVIDTDKFVFPRGADINGKTVFQKTVVKKSDVSSVENKFHKGDGIISSDCFFYTLKLKNGTKVTVTLCEYGKEAEKEILEIIQNSIT